MRKADYSLSSDNFFFICFFLGVMLCITGTYVFAVGYHSADMGHNMKWLNCYYDTVLVDYTSDGSVVGHLEAYRAGWQQVRVGTAMLTVGGLFLGFAASGYNQHKRRSN